MQAVFKMEFHNKDLPLLKQIQCFFGVGVLSTQKTRNSTYYSAYSLEHLNKVIIPHFLKYPLITQKKRADFILFKAAIELMNKGEHLTYAGLIKILAIKASMNLGLSSTLKGCFPSIPLIPRPEVKDQEILDPN